MAADKLEKQFSLDVLNQERMRSRLLAVVIFLVLVGFIANGFFYLDDFNLFFSDKFYLFIGIGLLFMLAVRAMVISVMLPKWFRIWGELPKFIRYVNVFLEISVPSMAIVLFTNQVNPINALLAPITDVYFLFILLSVLEMEFKLSLFSGLLAGIQYLAISLYFTHDANVPEGFHFFYAPVNYLGRAIILSIAGITAGVIGHQIKKRVLDYYLELQKIDRMEKIFGQQLSSEVARELLEKNVVIQSRSRMVCVMFLDIRGFTVITEHKTPEEIIAYQNAVFPFMIEIVHQHHGIVNQLLGDGFMATFGAPVSMDNDCQNAVYAALDILKELDHKNNTHAFDETRIGIGLHYGQVVNGNVGSELRKQYSITGQTVIISSRIEELNKKYGSSLLISKSVKENFDQIPAEFVSLGQENINGYSTPIELFRLV